MNILVTNDDGIYSPGLKLLYNFVKDLGRVYVVAPETPKSASGLGITLHKPLRVSKMELEGMEAHATSGTPSDTIYLAVLEIADKIDVVISGINIGDNTSLQVVLSSGTIGAALQAALLGIPAIALSADVNEPEELLADPALISAIRNIARASIKFVSSNGMPRGVDVISINFPRRFKPGAEVKLVPAAKVKFSQKIDRRRDPRGGAYYWLYGELVEPEPETDVYVVHKEGNIALTPLTFNMNALGPRAEADLKTLGALVDELNRSLGK
ncbi:MAG: 5'/3'-nucleotidase SurE [Thermoproteus sp. AZ2]|uniref:5'/3'-nucleotidase SurE n=1 Tax=Thermoproteus sp. AZ2 TaxID=1609232 RepID=A0ACC6V347_9CREN|nr:MAG: stationary phase survival protein SurE [Thermoproteus sp. AZ2]